MSEPTRTIPEPETDKWNSDVSPFVIDTYASLIVTLKLYCLLNYLI